MTRLPRSSVLLFTLVLAFALTGCSWFSGSHDSSSDKKASKEDEKSKRIAILESTHKIEADKDLSGTKPQVPAVFVNANWPQVGYDTSHVMPDAAISDHPQELWAADIGEGSDSDFKLLARPVVANGVIFTMDSHGKVSAFDTKSGDRKWELDTTPEDRDEDTIGGGIGVSGDTIYATTGFGEVLAIKIADGSVKWRRMLGNPIRGAPTIADNRVYAVDINNELQALDTQKGDVLWHHNGISESATLMGASSPAVSSDSVIAAYSSGEVYDLRPENGRAVWNYVLTMPTQMGALPAIADIRGLPVLDNGRVYAVSHSGRIAAIDQRTGDRAWEADVGGVNTPVVAGDGIFMLSNDSQLIALTRDTGRIIWIHELQKLADPDDHDSDKVFWTGPVLAGGKLWLGNSLGQLIAFSTDDGHPSDPIDLSKPIFVPPIVADGIMYVVRDNGTLIALH
jgi:outer membrane protein assembly factor BamB